MSEGLVEGGRVKERRRREEFEEEFSRHGATR